MNKRRRFKAKRRRLYSLRIRHGKWFDRINFRSFVLTLW
jgi:hypothetical protein